MSTTILSLLLILLRAGLSSQEEIVSRTVSPSTTTRPESSPKPTTFDLSKRADHIPPNFCGWYSGSGYDNRWTYNDPSVTCFWNSDAKFVGDPTQPQTACIGNTELSTWSCSGSGCSTSVAKCTGTQPYCVTFSYGLDYLSFVCSEEEGIEYQMEPYWSGFTSPIAFPVYTGAKGVSTGTQYPAGYSTPSSTSSDSDSGSGSNTDSNLKSHSASASYITAYSSGTAVSNPSQHHGSSTPVGPIVGGVIGGLIFVSLSVGVSVYFGVIRRRRERRAGQGQGQPHPPSQPQQPPGFPPGSQPYPSPHQYPPSQFMAPFGAAKSGVPQSPPPQQPLRYEVETQYNKPELDISRQQSERAYLSQTQHAELPGMQHLQPEYVSMAQRPS
ncbi:unnamed protein product [Penicillium pancosmium]